MKTTSNYEDWVTLINLAKSQCKSKISSSFGCEPDTSKALESEGYSVETIGVYNLISW